MSGVHDVGGKSGYGTPATNNSPGYRGSAFAARWEAAVFAMMRALGAAGVMKNSDQFRHAVERVAPRAYFAHGYYGRWLGGLETLLVEAGVLQRSTLDARVQQLAKALGATQAQGEELVADHNVASRTWSAAQQDSVPASANAGSAVRYLSQPPRFELDDRVIAVGCEPHHPLAHHTRLPEYARGAQGRVVALHNGWVLPDTNAHGAGESPAHLYTVAFSAQSLYGPESEDAVTVHLDLFEPYLEAVA